MLLSVMRPPCWLVLLTATAALTTFARATQICCPGAGCFNDSSPYWWLPLPQCAEDQMISMKVYTQRNPTAGQNISRSQIPAAFNGSRLTIFVVHGWLQSEREPWMWTMKNTLLEKGDYNVVIVGWPGGSQQLYTQSVSNTRTVGTEIGLVAANLIANGNSDKSRLYCVGHSLGAHVCGQAGMKTKFGRNTGLDPAGPLFESRSIYAGLNPTAADLVDVIHTHGGGPFGPVHLGLMRRLGHVDFYPNGGQVQPNCILEGGAFTGPLPDLQVGCSHIRAYLLFTESILTPRCNSRFMCTDEEKLPASCTTNGTVVQSLGFNADNYKARGIFYLTTRGSSPYCIG